MERRIGVKIKKYHNFNESTVEKIDIITSIQAIFEIYPTYFEVLKYLKNNLIGKEVEFIPKKNYLSGGKFQEKSPSVKMLIKDVLLDTDSYIFFFLDDTNRYPVNEYQDIKYTKSINRTITVEDPYGEEDW